MPRWTANKQVNNVEVEHKLNGENNSTREARLSGPLRQFFSFVSIHTQCRHAHISLYYSLVMCFLFILFSLFPLVWCACHVSVAWKRGARSSYCSISLFAMSEEKQKQKTQFQARAKDAFTKLLMPIMWGEQASLRCTERVNKLSAEKWKSAYNRTKVIRCVVCMLSVTLLTMPRPSCKSVVPTYLCLTWIRRASCITHGCWTQTQSPHKLFIKWIRVEWSELNACLTDERQTNKQTNERKLLIDIIFFFRLINTIY